MIFSISENTCNKYFYFKKYLFMNIILIMKFLNKWNKNVLHHDKRNTFCSIQIMRKGTRRRHKFIFLQKKIFSIPENTCNKYFYCKKYFFMKFFNKWNKNVLHYDKRDALCSIEIMRRGTRKRYKFIFLLFFLQQVVVLTKGR